ncbi:MAG: A24 family peptidase [Deltaproteobacteria bacterium]
MPASSFPRSIRSFLERSFALAARALWWLEGPPHASIQSVVPDSFLISLVVLLGAMLGSFLNVVIYRVPCGESIVHPRSHCPGCGHILAAWENIPVLSWVLLRARCRGCGNAISPRYPIVEILCGLLAWALYRRFGPTPEFLGFAIFSYLLVALTYIDLDHQLLPDRLTLPGLGVGLLAAPLIHRAQPLPAFGDAALGALVGGGILYLVAWSYEKATGREGMGGGDIKFLAMIGAFLGWQGVLLTLFLGSIVGSVIGVATMVARREDTKLALPFGPFLAIGALVTLFQGDAILAWYLGTMRL